MPEYLGYALLAVLMNGCLIYVMVAVETEDTAGKTARPARQRRQRDFSLPIAANGDGAATASSPGF